MMTRATTMVNATWNNVLSRFNRGHNIDFLGDGFDIGFDLMSERVWIKPTGDMWIRGNGYYNIAKLTLGYGNKVLLSLELPAGLRFEFPLEEFQELVRRGLDHIRLEVTSRPESN